MRYLPLAWQMAADPDGKHAPPPPPRPPYHHGGLIAWWSPLAQLVMYGLGWAYPVRGLARWDQTGRPTDEPVLAAVQRWWGSHLDDYLAWGAGNKPGEYEGPDLSLGRQQVPVRGTLFQQYWHRTVDQDWIDVWGHPGDNRFHLPLHTRIPWEDSGEPVPPVLRHGKNVQQAIVLDRYPGWYRALMYTGEGTIGGRSRRVDVVVRSLGWLGTYRKSRDTGLWFRGTHSLHLLGNESIRDQ